MREDFVDVAILVLIALAHVQLAKQGLAGKLRTCQTRVKDPAPGGQIFVTRKQELETQSASAVIQINPEMKHKASSESASPYSSNSRVLVTEVYKQFGGDITTPNWERMHGYNKYHRS